MGFSSHALPAGNSTFQQDQPHEARASRSLRHMPRTAPPKMHSQTVPGASSQLQPFLTTYHPNRSFGRDTTFTNDGYFLTARQSHVPDLRRIHRSSPNLVA